MILIRFKEPESERRALGCLIANGVPGKTWKNGQTAVPENGLALLSERGIPFEVIGEATYEQLAPLRDLAAEAV
jgi:hypothetical protein